MNGEKFITFCFFDGNTAENGRGNDVFFNGSSITQSPFNQCGSTTESKRVWNAGTADNSEYNGWLPLITTYKIVANNGTDTNLCGITQLRPCASIEFALLYMTDTQYSSLTLLSSTFAPTETLTFSAVDTKITGNGIDVTTIASSGIPQPASSLSSSPDPSASSALFQQIQGSLTVSALSIAHNSSNQITPILFHLSNDSPSLNLNTTTITGTTSIPIKTPLFFLTAGSLALNHTAITRLALNSQSIFHLASLTAPLTLNSSNITDITSTATPTSCVLSSATSPALSLSLANCTMTNINSAPQHQQTATDGGCISFASSASDNTFSVSDSTFSTCSVSEDTSSGGRGGALMIEFKDDSEVSSTTFSMTNIMFSANKASVGRDVYFVCDSLVASVKEPSFAFMRSISPKDNSIAGHDKTEAFSDWDVDLFIFLDGFFADKVFIDGISGMEVLYCGIEKVPCKSVDFGAGHLKRTQNTKEEIILCSKSTVTGCVDVGGMSVKAKAETAVEMECQTEVSGSEDESILKSSSQTEMKFIGIVVPSSFNRTIASVIESSTQNGELHMKNCEMSVTGGMQNTIGFSLIKSTGKMVELDSVTISDVKSSVTLFSLSPSSGTLEVNDLSMESCNVGNSIFAIHDTGVSCHFVNVRVESLNESGGCLLLIKGTESTTKINEVGEEMNLNIDKSLFSGVKRSDNGASILESASEKKICLVVNASNITEDKAERSEKGGAMFFTLGASGSMKMIDSTISHCSCSGSTGKGGGVYLATKERGKLDFLFVGMKFSANTARVGNDIFIECFNITSQINESQFRFDLRENHYSRINAIYGIDSWEHKEDTDLMAFITIHQSDTIIVSSVNGSNERQCGTNTLPCDSIDYGLMHLTSDFMSLMFIVEESVICGEMNLKEMSMSSKSRENCDVEVEAGIERAKESLVTTTGEVSLLRVRFVFDSDFISQHESLISPDGGMLEIMNCSFSSKQSDEEGNSAFANIPFRIINMAKGELQLDGCTMSNLILQESAFHLSSQLPSVIDSLTINNSTIKTSQIVINECGQLNMEKFHTENISVEGDEESLISCFSLKKATQLTNCTMGGVSSKTTKGKLMEMEDCLDVKMDSCIFDGNSKERNEQYLNEKEEMCRWEGSLVDVSNSSVMMKDTTIMNSPEGGITMSKGNVNIETGLFEKNNPSFEGYPSLRRNIICSDSGTLNVMSLKGGDGVLPNTSLWMLNEGCSFEGIVSERDSSFFIPVLESVKAKEETDKMKLTFKGMLLVPCNLSFSVEKRKGEEKEIEKHDFDSNGFLSEREVEGSVAKGLISICGDEVEVSVHVLFGNAESPSSTDSFILKNASEAKANGDERVVEGGKEGKSYWLLIVIVLVVILLIVFVVSVVVTIRWRKAKKENKDLREIVNDTVKKDPKLIEMVTMEMSPEEQWRRAEKEAEKKNEERIKKRVNEKSLGHSESSEHLLSESGSTEYILGKDSDKIPDWALEKEEEEETRKRTPSPSISSTSTTDSDSTFVRGEDLCPTTSSMSNLVDAMACSSPHEKLIVDLRDSLFMLLHGRNKTKEMPIGSLNEREMTASQILFWVANLALHSFDEMEIPLQSLSNLSPHIVLFSEHMVICIVMHSDLLSSDDSDSSSISLVTMVSSSSNISVMSERFTDSPPPSSAFEDEDCFKKECLRWKAPELLIDKKMGATKESVVFSIGMMLWECLTLQIPFGEYDGEGAGQKIVNGERPALEELQANSYFETIKSCISSSAEDRPSLTQLKREFIKRFPAEMVIVTMSDAIELGESSEEKEMKKSECEKSDESGTNTNENSAQ
ncbi:uncharacterized protein MONOS_12157 [Monocercomonoides exilis]|uniref:uncharacterized protein n=1 Tax=Monocercomonoides exilis TaxID=2049356 RepID=UPI00355A3CDC|nr:hypothetical protein MONOS_12157 [Monocercomonoides exilis]|eukprot:MONOS_12157.1-p1 / transcript=MONOS_12157.1 / gene=MONOS_12157 / organism=Monocercomonoides_exilis_PA203 / gene_product=unspecified product / transcript_product=unspecified product / location=Mono_scaffold00654:1359-6791(+) / protein_length=1810 / sequence_SO=supercontig / SO=protein_coding / is_pseudo=false